MFVEFLTSKPGVCKKQLISDLIYSSRRTFQNTDIYQDSFQLNLKDQNFLYLLNL